MTREYELVYIFDSSLEEAQINERLERFRALLKCPEAPEPVTATNHWGKRTLAYQVKGKEVGYYVVEQFTTRPDLLGELERAIKLDEGVLRHLIVLNEGLTAAATSALDLAATRRREEDDEDAEEGDEP